MDKLKHPQNLRQESVIARPAHSWRAELDVANIHSHRPHQDSSIHLYHCFIAYVRLSSAYRM